MTFAEDASDEVPDRPLLVQVAGGVDFVMHPKKIAAELQRLALKMAGKGPARGGNAT